MAHYADHVFFLCTGMLQTALPYPLTQEIEQANSKQNHCDDAHNGCTYNK